MAIGCSVDFGGKPHVSDLEPVWVHCVTCGHEWAPCLAPAPMDVVARSLKAMGKCPLCRGKKGRAVMGRTPREVPPGSPLDWLLYSFDTGISSETIYFAITGQQPNRKHWRAGVPHDADDFGRCYRLLKHMEAFEWRTKHLPKVAECYPEWRPFIDAWDELTALYEAKQWPQLYARLKACEGFTEHTPTFIPTGGFRC